MINSSYIEKKHNDVDVNRITHRILRRVAKILEFLKSIVIVYLAIFVYIFGKVVGYIANLRVFKKLFHKLKLKLFELRVSDQIVIIRDFVDQIFITPDRIRELDLIALSIKNLSVKRSRTLITVSGISIAISVIVYLVSIGYGLQDVVITRLTSHKEMTQFDILPQSGKEVKIDDNALKEIENFSDVEKVLPLISVVGHIDYNNSAYDIAAYGVVTDYFVESDMKLSSGEFFESNEIVLEIEEQLSGEEITLDRKVIEIPLEEQENIDQRVMGIEDDSQLEIEWLESEEDTDIQEVNYLVLSENAKKVTVVNQAMLDILGINQHDAIDTTFNVSFIALEKVVEGRKTESKPSEYKIVGVISDDSAVPIFYVPFIDLRASGIAYYSQAKVTIADRSILEELRLKVESMGFVTKSVVDTVSQIQSLFGTLRIILALLGIGALLVASLGMFNTLTVSLLERTREVGLMKALGAKSSEVKDLFLTEAIVMSSLGGVAGIILGFLLGKLTSILISLFIVFKGVSFVDISKVPIILSVSVVGLSLIVGVLTGIYPATRSGKISALDALRYE